VAAALAAAAAALIAARLRAGAAPARPARPSIAAAVREGAAFAIRHELLRGIVLCAVFWNFAFFALLAIAVPYAMRRVGLDAAATGLMQSGHGLGLILGAALAGGALQRFEPRLILIAGPALSVLAAALLLAAPASGFPAAFAGLFLVGFGPMLWLVCQASIRQLVTPPDLLGRVAAMIQVAIYGVRPLGALAGGAAAALAGLNAAMALVLLGFALSLSVPLVSALGRLRALPTAVAAGA
jgi:predicted MFS family arabinose efflux permease